MSRISVRIGFLLVVALGLSLNADENTSADINAQQSEESIFKVDSETEEQLKEEQESQDQYEPPYCYYDHDIYYDTLPNTCDDGWSWEYWGNYDEECGSGVSGCRKGPRF